MTIEFPAPPGDDPFALIFEVDDDTVRVENRVPGVGDRELPNMTFVLSDGSKILVSQIPLPAPPFAASGQIRIDAGSRKVSAGTASAAPFRFHVHKPGMGRAPAPGKNHSLPGEMRPAKPQPAKKSG